MLKSTFELGGSFFLSGDGLMLRVLPFGVLTRGAGDPVALVWRSYLSFGLPVFTQWSFLTLVLSELSLRAEVTL